MRVEYLQMIKSMVVDLEVDATLGDGFNYYCFFFSQKQLGFIKSYLTLFWKNTANGWGFENTCTLSRK